MKIFLILIALCGLGLASGTRADEPAHVTLDENTWVLFYDLPSRRFRAIREAHLARDWGRASSDLKVSAAFLEAEAARAVTPLQAPLQEVIQTLSDLAAVDSASEVAGDQLDSAFARAHWLLAQHYLVLARDARDTDAHRLAGIYVLATAHHMERAALWSDAKLTRRLAQTLDQLREYGYELQSAADTASIYRKKPVVAAETTLREIGVLIDRKVWLN